MSAGPLRPPPTKAAPRLPTDPGGRPEVAYPLGGRGGPGGRERGQSPPAGACPPEPAAPPPWGAWVMPTAHSDAQQEMERHFLKHDRLLSLSPFPRVGRTRRAPHRAAFLLTPRPAFGRGNPGRWSPARSRPSRPNAGRRPTRGPIRSPAPLTHWPRPQPPPPGARQCTSATPTCSSTSTLVAHLAGSPPTGSGNTHPATSASAGACNPFGGHLRVWSLPGVGRHHGQGLVPPRPPIHCRPPVSWRYHAIVGAAALRSIYRADFVSRKPPLCPERGMGVWQWGVSTG